MPDTPAANPANPANPAAAPEGPAPARRATAAELLASIGDAPAPAPDKPAEPKAASDAGKGAPADKAADKAAEKGSEKDAPAEGAEHEKDGRPEAARRIAEKERKRATEEAKRAQSYFAEGEKIRAEAKAEIEKAREEFATREKQLVEMDKAFKAALHDPEKLLDFAAKASGKSHRDVMNGMIRRLQGLEDAPAPPDTSKYDAGLEEIKKELAALRAEKQASEQKAQQEAAVREIHAGIAADLKAALDDPDTAILGVATEKEVVDRVFQIKADYWRRTKKDLDNGEVFRTLANELEENRKRYAAFGTPKAQTAGQASSTASSQGQRAPQATIASVSGGNSAATRDYFSLSREEKARHLADLVK